MSNRIENERVKRNYFNYLRNAVGLSEASVEAVEKAIWQFEDFSVHSDFRKFDRNQAIKYKNWLDSKKLSASTLYQRLKHLKGFFVWLSWQPGYKSRIRMDDIAYLNLERNKVREATAPRSADFPDLDYVKALVGSITPVSEVDRRDRALISFLLLSGMRDLAVATLPIGCFDKETLQVRQLPSMGVRTKFGKPIVSWLFKVDSEMLTHVIEWSEYLEVVRKFPREAPLFPRTKIQQGEKTLSFEAVGVEPRFWQSADPIRSILDYRAKQAGLRYYKPHAFRHLADFLASKYCTSIEQFKAISQNFGHANVATTLSVYGRLNDRQVGESIKALEFEKNNDELSKKKKVALMKRLLEDFENDA